MLLFVKYFLKYSLKNLLRNFLKNQKKQCLLDCLPKKRIQPRTLEKSVSLPKVCNLHLFAAAHYLFHL